MVDDEMGLVAQRDPRRLRTQQIVGVLGGAERRACAEPLVEVADPMQHVARHRQIGAHHEPARKPIRRRNHRMVFQLDRNRQVIGIAGQNAAADDRRTAQRRETAGERDEIIGVEAAVVVGHRDDRAAHGGETDVPRARQAGPVAVEQVDGEGLLRLPRCQPIGRGVGRAIVDDDDLDRRGAFLRGGVGDRGEQARQSSGAVTRADEQADRRDGGHAATDRGDDGSAWSRRGLPWVHVAT